MNKILVLFDSATGNLQQMAELVGEGAALMLFYKVGPTPSTW